MDVTINRIKLDLFDQVDPKLLSYKINGFDRIRIESLIKMLVVETL